MAQLRYGILSLNIYERDNNWGSILQTWALQETLTMMGADIKVVNYKPDAIKPIKARYPVLNKLPLHIKTLHREYKNDLADWRDYVQRDDKFKKFIQKYYITTEYVDSRRIERLELDGYIVGSDIVWHIPFWNGFDRGYFCDYENMRDCHNIAYAPSMADQCFSEEEGDKFRVLLKNFNRISVREQSKVDYVQGFTDKEVISVLDPTLLLVRENYDPLLVPNPVKEDYILLYTVAPDQSLIDYVKNYAGQIGRKIVRVKCQGPDPLTEDWTTFNQAGIEEWLTLIAHAHTIFTNSYHCCIFSILYRKRFFTTYREFGKFKILDLLNSLGMNNHSSNSERCDFNDKYIFEYDKVYEKLNKRRKISMEFLQEAIRRGEYGFS